MPTPSQRITAYFAKQPPFAKVICVELRKLLHQAVPDIQEDWRWGPSFSQNGLVCNIGPFKHHVRLTFFYGASMKDSKKLFNDGFENLHSRAIIYTDVQQISKRDIITYYKEAVAINAGGRKLPMKGEPRASNPLPSDVKRLLKQAVLLDHFHQRPPYQRRDYINWLAQAKRPETRAKRIETMIDDLRSGRYMKMKWGSLQSKKK